MFSPDAVAVVVVGVVYFADRFGLLDRLGLRRTAQEAAAELEIRQQAIDRLRAERNEAREKVLKLERTHSLEPILDQMHANATLASEILDRLVHHNGAFAQMEKSLAAIAHGLDVIADRLEHVRQD